jgi:hypothetical protein
LKWFERHTGPECDVLEFLWTFTCPEAIPTIIRKGEAPFAVTITGEVSPLRTGKMIGLWRHPMKVTATGLTVTGPDKLCPYYDADHKRHLLRDKETWRLALAGGEPIRLRCRLKPSLSFSRNRGSSPFSVWSTKGRK